MNISLVSIPLIVTAAILAVLSLVFLPLLQLRFSQKKGIRIGQNLLVLVTAGALVAGAMGLAVNYPMQYISNTDSLISLLWPDTKREVDVTDLGKLAGDPHQDLEIASLKQGLAELPSDLEIKHTRGRNYLLKFTAPKSGIKKPVMVWLPRGYHKNDGKTYNVLTFLHGYPGTIYGVSTAMKFDKYLQKAIDEHRIPPTIAVIPENNTLRGAPLCADAKEYPATSTFLAEDIPLVVKKLYPNVTDKRSGWMISGTSSGAYCAGRIGVVRGDVFGSMALLSGYNPPEVGPWSNPTNSAYPENTLTSLFTVNRPWPLKIYAFSAFYDSDGAELNAELEKVRWRGGDVLYRVSNYKGGHNWRTWSMQLEPLMRWWGDRIRENRWNLDGHSPVLRTIGPERVEAANIPLFSLMGWGTIGIFAIFTLLINGMVLFRDPRIRRDLDELKKTVFWARYARNFGFLLVAALSAAALPALLLNRSEQFFPVAWELFDYLRIF